jgi:transcriptional regulator with XRE-family HTH domain
MPEKKGFFAERLKALRDEAGLSQPQLADRSGVGVSTIRQFEYGRREPTYGTLVKLAGGLGVSLAAFEPDGSQAGGRPPKATPSTPPAAELEAVPKKPRGRRRKGK